MIIRAIRLRETGCFTKPVALENLSGTLDVLSEPNERGKSTLLRALRALFFARHSSAAVGDNSLLFNLKPLGGGAPLVEVDFEVDGNSWRLRKQFLSGKQASLADLSASKIVARGDDADARALQLLKAHPGSDKPDGKLLWVGQRDALSAIPPSAVEHASLRGLIEAEVENVADGGQAHDIRGQVGVLLKELVTAKAKKPTGVYAVALKEEVNLRDQLAAARIKAGDAQARLQQLQQLTSQERDMRDPDATAERAVKLEQTKNTLGAAQIAREKLLAARAVVEKCEAEQAKKAAELEVFKSTLDEHRKLIIAQGEMNAKLGLLDLELAEFDKNAQSASRQVEGLQENLDKARADLVKHEQMEQLRAAKVQLKAQQNKLTRARQAGALADKLHVELKQMPVTKLLVGKAHELSRAVLACEAQLNAAAPRVAIALAPGGIGKITAQGQALNDDTVLQREGPLVLEIDGVGVITIEAGASDRLDETREDRDAQAQELAHCLAAMDVKDLDAAQVALKLRSETEEQFERARLEVEAFAPEGLPVLEHEVEQVAQKAQGDVPDEIASHAALTKNVDRLVQEYRAGMKDLAALTTKGNLARTNQAGLNAKMQAHGQRHEELNARLPQTDKERAVKLDILVNGLAAAERAVNAAKRDLGDWQEKAGDDDSLKTLQRNYQLQQEKSAAISNELNKIEHEIGRTQSALQVLAHDGVETRVRELEEQLEVAAGKVERFKKDVAALQLLDDTLKEALAATQDRFLQPVVKAIAPFLDLVLPGAAVELGDNLDVKALSRPSGRHSLNLLSAGTQEQIAVLVRLGFGRLLAEAGTPVPVILDDALVYSDDERMGRAFEALHLASRLHQVIVLTCRASSFEQLAGNRLTLEDWDPDGTQV